MSSADTSRAQLPEVTVNFAAALFGCPVTETVMFYLQGDRDAEAYPATVQLCHANGQINIIAHRGAMGEKRNAVRHIDDPYFKEHPNVLRKEGAWDYGPGKAPRMDGGFPINVEAAVLEIIKLRNNNQRLSKIEQLIRPMLTIGGQLAVEPKNIVAYAIGKFMPADRPAIRQK